MYGPNNSDRAARAENAVNVFGMETYCGRNFTVSVKEQSDVGEDAYTMCQDLISDILPLAREHGWEAERMIRNAVGAFEEEVAEEAEESDNVAANVEQFGGTAGNDFAHLPENCPSKHWNRGDDICGDCGENLQ